MTRLAVMQPYFFPYIGYFQMIAAVDRFVVYDDVAFIKNGWINRNRILGRSGPEFFTVPLQGASSFRPINETACAPPRMWRDKMLRTIEQGYARAPQLTAGVEIARNVLAEADRGSIRDLAVASIRAVCAYAELKTNLVESSTKYENAGLSGSRRLIDICHREAASEYVNSPGGRALYNSAEFRDAGLDLRFIEPVLDPYPQVRKGGFVAGLSVIDLIMSVPREEVAQRLRAGVVTE